MLDTEWAGEFPALHRWTRMASDKLLQNPEGREGTTRYLGEDLANVEGAADSKTLRCRWDWADERQTARKAESSQRCITVRVTETRSERWQP